MANNVCHDVMSSINILQHVFLDNTIDKYLFVCVFEGGYMGNSSSSFNDEALEKVSKLIN